jgi:hypothetical protein
MIEMHSVTFRACYKEQALLGRVQRTVEGRSQLTSIRCAPSARKGCRRRCLVNTSGAAVTQQRFSPLPSSVTGDQVPCVSLRERKFRYLYR